MSDAGPWPPVQTSSSTVGPLLLCTFQISELLQCMYRDQHCLFLKYVFFFPVNLFNAFTLIDSFWEPTEKTRWQNQSIRSNVQALLCWTHGSFQMSKLLRTVLLWIVMCVFVSPPDTLTVRSSLTLVVRIKETFDIYWSVLLSPAHLAS